MMGNVRNSSVPSDTGELPVKAKAFAEQRIRQFFLHKRAWISLLMGLVLLLQIQSWWRPTPDVAAYLSIARSLAAGDGPLRFGSHHLLYQPAFPFLISPLFRLSHEPFLLLSIFQVILAALTLFALWRWARTYYGAGAIVVVALTCANVCFLNFTRSILTEIPSMLLLLLAGLAIRHTLQPGLSRKQFAGRSAACAVVVLAACMMRYVSFCLIPGLLLAAAVAFWQKRRPIGRMLVLAGLTGLPTISAMLCWIIRDKGYANSSEQTNVAYLLTTKLGIVARLIESIRMRTSVFGRLAIPGMDSTYGSYGEWLNPIMLLYLPVFLLVVWGWWKLLRRTGDVLIAAMPFYFLVYLAWPDDSGVRFFVPIIPMMWMCLWRLMAANRTWRYSVALGLIVMHLCVSLAMQTKYHFQEGSEYRRLWPELVELKPALMPYRHALALRGMKRNDPQWWLSFLLDRPVHRVLPGATPPDWMQAVVQPVGMDIPQGFVAGTTYGDLQVLTRSNSGSTPASSPLADPLPLSRFLRSSPVDVDPAMQLPIGGKKRTGEKRGRDSI